MYYYNAKTRESAWTKPENVKIITQSEVEQMAAQAGGQTGGQNGAAANNTGTTTTAAQAAQAQG